MGDESTVDHSLVPDLPPRFIELPFRLENADLHELPGYARLPSKPPLFYPRVVDVFSWIDLAKPDWHTLQDLMERPDLAEDTFPFSPVNEPTVFSGVNDFPFIESSQAQDDSPMDAVDLFVARLSEEAASAVDEEVLSERMRVNPPTEQDLLKGIAFLESLRNDGSVISEPPATLPIASPPPVPPEPVADKTTMPQPTPVAAGIAVNPPSPAILPPGPATATEATLRMAATVPLPNGGQRPAFASEFFLTTRQLEDLLTEAIPYPSAASDVRQLIRLWAESEKRAGGQGVKLALNVKSVLIKAQVSKVLTDFNGEAEVAGLKPDDYYLIGIDKDDETGIVTIWSKRIAISRGDNHVELSLEDIVWNK
ncbi:MAG: hypothetical protein VCA36_12645 [Opitutales bacterium]